MSGRPLALHDRVARALPGMAADQLEHDGLDDLRAAIVARLQELDRSSRRYEYMPPPTWRDWSLVAVLALRLSDLAEAAQQRRTRALRRV